MINGLWNKPLGRPEHALLLTTLFAVLCLLVTPQRVAAQIAFTDVSSAAKVRRATESFGASWGDLNGDGYPDIYANNHRLQDSLFLNRGDGTFFETATQVGTWQNHSRADTHGGAWADFDNDGDQDLLISAGSGNVMELLVNDYGRLVDRTIAFGLASAKSDGRMPVWVDYDGDRRMDFVLAYHGASKLFQQSSAGTAFIDQTAASRLNCVHNQYAQLYDATDDGQLDFLCPDEAVFPQKIYSMVSFPWQKVYDSASPSSLFPLLKNVTDATIADFDNDGRSDVFALSGVTLRPAGVVQKGSNYFEANLVGSTKGFKFVSAGKVTFTMDWNKADGGAAVELTKISIGSGRRHPATIPFTLDAADSSVVGMPPSVTSQSDLPSMQIGYDPVARRWTAVIQTKLATTPSVFSMAYLQISTTQPIADLKTVGMWPTDGAARPSLVMNLSGARLDRTVDAGISTPVQCASVTSGDFDNDMDVDLYLACRTGASNIANILYQNRGDGTFTAVPNAGGAAGPIGLAVSDGAGTADSVIAGDYNVDGFLDLFVTNGFNMRPSGFGGPNALFRNKGNSNRWIEIDLVATQSNRDALGARVYATANGVTQFRVQDGGYHRWSQNSKRVHFGLAGASSVTLRVEWPSGAVQTFQNVSTSRLYRITEGSSIAPVALGVAPAYACGTPPMNAAVDVGVFVWRDCPTGDWRLRTLSGGGTVTYTGTVTSSSAYTTVKGIGLSSADSMDYTTDPRRISFTFSTKGTGADGVNFMSADGSSACLRMSAPTGVKLFYGPFRKPLAQPLDVRTQAPC